MPVFVLVIFVALGSMLVGGIMGAHDGFKGGEISAQRGDKTYIIQDGNVYHKEKDPKGIDD